MQSGINELLHRLVFNPCFWVFWNSPGFPQGLKKKLGTISVRSQDPRRARPPTSVAAPRALGRLVSLLHSSILARPTPHRRYRVLPLSFGTLPPGPFSRRTPPHPWGGGPARRAAFFQPQDPTSPVKRPTLHRRNRAPPLLTGPGWTRRKFPFTFFLPLGKGVGSPFAPSVSVCRKGGGVAWDPQETRRNILLPQPARSPAG